jgi:hypothetical protein
MSDGLKEGNILKLVLIVRFACATLDVGYPIYPPDPALPPNNLTLHFSHQYLQTQWAEQDFFKKNSFFIERGVKSINSIRPIIAEIGRSINVR